MLKTPQNFAEEPQASKSQKGNDAKDNKKPTDDVKEAVEAPLKKLLSESGLGGLVGNAKHGVSRYVRVLSALR